MRTILTFILLLLCHRSDAQLFNNISRFTTQNGLSNNTITCLQKDSSGFLWIGTHEGLNRYDGTEFINVLSNNKNNLPSNNINKIAVMKGGMIAVGTDAGLCLLDMVTFRGKEIVLPTDAKYLSGAIGIWDLLYQKESGELWVSTWYGLFVIDSNGKILRKIMGTPSEMSRGYFAKNILRDIKGDVYFFSQQKGAFFYPDFAEHLLIPVEQRDPRSVFNTMIRNGYSMMGAFSNNRETVCTFSKKGDIDMEEYIVYDNLLTGRRFSDRINIDLPVEKRVSNAFSLNDSVLLVNSYFGEPMLYNSFSKKCSRASDQPLWFTSWPDGIGTNFCKDEQSLWVGTSNGLLQAITKENHFYTNTVLRNTVTAIQSIVSFNYGIYQNNRFLLSCMGSGLFGLDTATNTVRNYFPVGIPKEFGSKRISLNIIPEGKQAWLFTVYGPVLVDIESGRFSFPKDSSKSAAFDASASYGFADSRGQIWATLPDGVTKFSPASQSFTNFTTKYKGGNFPLLRAGPKTEDSRGNIWMARQDTLVQYDPATGKFNTFLLRKDGRVIRPVTSISSDGGDVLYLAVGGSFGIYNTALHSLELYRKQTGIISTVINELVSDREGNAWMATEGGLVFYDKQKKKFSSFTKTDGLPDDNIVSLNFTANDKKTLFLGFAKTYCLFEPKDFLQDKIAPVNIITGVEVGGNNIVSETLPALDYNQNSISFTYTGINYNQGQQNNYACMLEGIDQDWKYTGTERKINYINLPPGKYTFKVKSADHQGKWNEQPASFSFEITPPFWKRWWFQALVGIAVILGIVFFIRQREAGIKKENAVKLQLSELRMQALRAQMNPHFIFNSLNSIQNYILSNNTIDAAGYLSKFAKLMRRILDQSKYNFLPLGEVMETLRLYVEIEAFRFSNEFDYNFDCPDDPDLLEVGIPPMLLQPFVENAILHGLMPKAGAKRLSISCRNAGDHAEIIIDDNGIGRTRHEEKAGHTSQGEKLTAGMLESMQHMQNGKSSIEIIDKTENGKATGTTIILKLPLN